MRILEKKEQYLSFFNFLIDLLSALDGKYIWKDSW